MDNRSLQKMKNTKDTITKNRKTININYLNTYPFLQNKNCLIQAQ